MFVIFGLCVVPMHGSLFHYSMLTSKKGINHCTPIQGLSWVPWLQGVSLLTLGWNVSPSQSYPQHFIRLSWQFTATYLYSEVDQGTRRVKWFEFNTKRTKHNVIARFEPKLLEPESSTPIIGICISHPYTNTVTYY